MNETVADDALKAQGRAADQKHCFSCGSILHVSAPQCPKCGAQQPSIHALQPVPQQAPSAQAPALNSHQVYCRGCAAVIHDSAVACPKCGAPQRVTSASSGSGSGKDRVTAGILAFLLGGIGGHKFYLGKWVQGILYLVFCWTLIPGVIAFVEAIIYLTMSDAEFSKRYS